MLSPISANEAVLSSRIEGTQATLEEVLQQDAGIEQDKARFADIEEIRNYRAALRLAEQELASRPISQSLIKAIHQRLMQGVRGQNKSPGQFRNDQNWIGSPGCKLEEARFVPPSPLLLQHAMDEWSAYLARSDEDPVLQAAIAHGQFEVLHPFKDGNGRIGRMLIPLLLCQRNALSRPMFYMSEYLESKRDEYNDALLSITKYETWQHWVEFFVQAVVQQADSNLLKVRHILQLYNSLKQQFISLTGSQFAVPALDAFFNHPVINASDFAEQARITTRATAGNLLSKLEAANLIHRLRESSGRAPAVFALPALLNAAEGRTIL